MLEIIKKRCYIYTNIYDEEIESLISAGIQDCVESGISKEKFQKNEKTNKYDDQILNCITNFVKANRGNDRSDTNIYMKMYESYRDKMTLESDYKENKS
jgi:hypothetical protein